MDSNLEASTSLTQGAIGAVTFVGFGMLYRYDIWYAKSEARLPPAMLSEVKRLEEDPLKNQRRLNEIQAMYYDDPTVRDDLLIFFALVLSTMPFIVMFGLWSAKRLAKSVTDVAGAAMAVAKGDFSVRAQVMRGTPAEIQRLAGDFNAMAERLQKYDRELRDSSAAIAHEIRTPLTSAKGRLQGMVDGVFSCDLKQVGMVVMQLDQLNRLVNDLRIYSLALAGRIDLHPSCFQLRELVDERIGWAAPQLEAEHMSAVNGVAADLAVTADRDRIGQVVTALIDNAVRYAAGGGIIEFAASEEDHMLSLRVLDRGPGIQPEHLTRIFDRFWRAEQSRGRHAGGSGLGLAIAAAICEAHQGYIFAVNRPDGGAEIRLSIPMDAQI
jgi:two-component system sensor histidine kinase AdeS